MVVVVDDGGGWMDVLACLVDGKVCDLVDFYSALFILFVSLWSTFLMLFSDRCAPAFNDETPADDI